MPWFMGFFRKYFLNLFARGGKFLLGLLLPLITPVLQFVAAFFKKIALLLLIVAALGLAIGVVAKAISASFGAISGFMPSEFLVLGRMFLPDNIPQCLALLVVARIKSLIFYWVSRLSEKLIHT